MGYARNTLSCIISSSTSQRPEFFTVSVPTCMQYPREKKRGIAKKLILTIRAIMIGEQIDVVGGDFLWHCMAVLQQQGQPQYY